MGEKLPFIQVQIYTKAECHLCDVAKEVLERVRQRLPFELTDYSVQRPCLSEQESDIPAIGLAARQPADQ